MCATGTPPSCVEPPQTVGPTDQTGPTPCRTSGLFCTLRRVDETGPNEPAVTGEPASDSERLPPPRTRVSFSLFEGDSVNWLFGLVGIRGRRVVDLALRCLMVIGLSWGVVALAALLSTHVKGVPARENFFQDFSAYLQFVVGLPLFVVAEDLVDQHTREAANYFLVSGVIAAKDEPAVENLNRRVAHVRKSVIPDLVCLFLAYSLAIVTIWPKTWSDCPTWHTTPKTAHNQPAEIEAALIEWRAYCTYTMQQRAQQNATASSSAAEPVATASPTAPGPPAVVATAAVHDQHKDDNSPPTRVPARLNAAGWCEMLVALPILNFWWLRWVWKIALWLWYLWRISRRRLVLTASHPDFTGGLGFVSDVQTQFGLAILAYGISNIASTVGYEIRIEQAPWSLYTVWCPLVIFVIGAPALFTLPLLMFTKQLYRVKKRAREELYQKAGERARAFEQVWRSSKTGAALRDDLFEWQELRNLFEHVEKMRIVPFDLRSLGELLFQTLGALVPLMAYLNPPEPLAKFLEAISHMFH